LQPARTYCGGWANIVANEAMTSQKFDDSLRIPVMVPRLPRWEKISHYGAQIDANRWYSNFGPLVCEFERRLAECFGGDVGTVLTCANATVGITLALQESMTNGSTACLLPSWTFVATAHAVSAAGLRPVFADVEPVDGQLTPSLAEQAIQQMPDIGAVIVVGPFGMGVDVDDWLSFRSRTGVPVIIDAAAGFDTAELSQLPTIVSLHATKALGCGEGGFVMSTDKDLISRIMGRSNFGFISRREAMSVGTNAKMSEYHAAVGLSALDEWPKTRATLMEIANDYRKRLSACQWASFQRGWAEDWISTTCNLKLESGFDSVRFCATLDKAGIDTRRWWGDGCHEQTAFANCVRFDLPATADLASRTVGLPFFQDLTTSNIDRIYDTLVSTVAPV
jgi:dTDP-4-amino-4,6-dideoxygalactose transaminase